MKNKKGTSSSTVDTFSSTQSPERKGKKGHTGTPTATATAIGTASPAPTQDEGANSIQEYHKLLQKLQSEPLMDLVSEDEEEEEEGEEKREERERYERVVSGSSREHDDEDEEGRMVRGGRRGRTRARKEERGTAGKEHLEKQLEVLSALLHNKSLEVERMQKNEKILQQQVELFSKVLKESAVKGKFNVKHQEEEEKGVGVEEEEEEEEEKEEEDWEELDQLLDLCLQAKDYAYAPYSKFRVGCILKTSDGKYYKGCNVENASYGLSICAERTAIVKAVSEGHKTFEKIVVSTDLTSSFVSPCGACRQFLREFGDMEVYMVKPNKTYQKVLLSALLPYSFTSTDLNEHSKQNDIKK